MGTRLAGLVRKEMLQLLRDRVVLALILWLYTIEVVICALALSFEAEEIPLAVVDLDRTPASRAVIESFLITESFTHVGHAASTAEAERWLHGGLAQVALVVPEGFQRQLARGETPALQVLLDGTSSNIAAQARSHALAIAARFPADAVAPTPAAGTVSPVLRTWYDPGQRYSSFTVLSMIALAALMVGVIYPAASIVREKEVGTIEQLRVTPIGTAELFVAKTFPTLVIGLLAVFPSLLITGLFGVPLRGSLALFLALTALFLVSAVAIGVVIAVLSRTLLQALLLAFFGLFPIMFLSGTVVPIESMPEVLQMLSLASPLRHYMDIVLGVFLKGAGLTELWPQALALLAIGLPLFGLSMAAFRRTMT
jgi:ABC-2 type transport system permease protein